MRSPSNILASHRDPVDLDCRTVPTAGGRTVGPMNAREAWRESRRVEVVIPIRTVLLVVAVYCGLAIA